MDYDRMTQVSLPEYKVEDGYHGKATYKSWKKKYRKMRIQFDQKMFYSNKYFKEEARAHETARRLALQNDQLLDFLLDVNSSGQIPQHLRIDIASDLAIIPPIPDVVSHEPIQCPTPESQAIYDEVRVGLEAQAAAKLTTTQPTTSLAVMLSTAPSFSLQALSPEQAADLTMNHPISYLTPDEIDELYYHEDLSHLDSPTATTSPTFPPPQTIPPHYSDKELESRNPHSVYNWLRQHEPQVFLQDGEDSNTLAAAASKPGALRGAGKRASVAAIAQQTKLETLDGADDEIFALETPTAKSAGKRKRISEEDTGYRPKGGSSRPYKKKKKEGDGQPKKPGRKSKAERASEVGIQETVKMEDSVLEH